MNALSSISPDIVKLTVAIYTYVEIPLHLIDLPASILFGVVFWRLRSTHLNLRLIFASFVAASFITSAFRLWYCLQLIVLRFDSTADVLHSIANLRTSAIYATGLHLLLLASERQMATSRSDTYEKTTHITAVIAFVVLMWLYSFAVTYSLDRQFAKYFVIAFTFVPVYTVSIGMMVRVRRTNFALWKKHRGSMASSKNFQVRENVVSARYLHKCFVVFVSIATVGWTGLIIYLFFRSVYKVPILEKFFGFVFDIAVALLAMAVVLTITVYNGKLRTQLRRRLKSEFVVTKRPQFTSIKSEALGHSKHSEEIAAVVVLRTVLYIPLARCRLLRKIAGAATSLLFFCPKDVTTAPGSIIWYDLLSMIVYWQSADQ